MSQVYSDGLKCLTVQKVEFFYCGCNKWAKAQQCKFLITVIKPNSCPRRNFYFSCIGDFKIAELFLGNNTLLNKESACLFNTV